MVCRCPSSCERPDEEYSALERDSRDADEKRLQRHRDRAALRSVCVSFTANGLHDASDDRRMEPIGWEEGRLVPRETPQHCGGERDVLLGTQCMDGEGDAEQERTDRQREEGCAYRSGLPDGKERCSVRRLPRDMPSAAMPECGNLRIDFKRSVVRISGMAEAVRPSAAAAVSTSPYTDPRAHELRADYLRAFGGDEIPVPVESIAEDLLGLRIEESAELDCSGILLPSERRT